MVKTRKMALIREKIAHDRVTRSSVKCRPLRTSTGQVLKTANRHYTKKILVSQVNKHYRSKTDSNIKSVKPCSLASLEKVDGTSAEECSQMKAPSVADFLEVNNNETASCEEAQVRMDIQGQEVNNQDTFQNKVNRTTDFDDSVEVAMLNETISQKKNNGSVIGNLEKNYIKNSESRHDQQEAVMQKSDIQKDVTQLTDYQKDHTYAKEVLLNTNEDKAVSSSTTKESIVAALDCVKASDKPKQKKERSNNSKKTKKELVVVSKGSGTVMFKNSEVTLQLNTGMSSEMPAKGIGVDCPYCNKVCNTFEQYRNHLRSHERKKTYCKESIKSYTSLNTNEKPFSCKVCDATFRHESSLKFHLRKHGNKRNYKCVNCGRRFSSNKYMKKHMKEKCGRAKYHCPICSKGFKSKSAMQQHKVEEHSGSKRDETTLHGLKRTYKCLECNQTYPDKEKAKEHSFEVHCGTAEDAESHLEIKDVVIDGGDVNEDEQEEQEDEESLTEFEDDAADPDYMPSDDSFNDDSGDESKSDLNGKNTKPGGDDIPAIQNTANYNTENYLEAVKPIVIRKTLPLNASKVDQVLAKYPVLMPRPVFSKSREETGNIKDGNKSSCNLNKEKKELTVRDQRLKETERSENLVVRSEGSLQSLKDQEVRGDLKRPSVTVTVNGASCTLPLVVTENEIFESAASLKPQIDKTKKPVSEGKTSSSPKKVKKNIVEKVTNEVIKKLETTVRKRQTSKITVNSCKSTVSNRKMRKNKGRAATVCKVIGRRKRKAQSKLAEEPCSETHFPDESPQDKVKRLLARLPVLVPKPNLSPLPSNSDSNPQPLPVSDVTSYDKLPEERLPSGSEVLPRGEKRSGPQLPSSVVDSSHVNLPTQSSDVSKNHSQSPLGQHPISRDSMSNLVFKKSNQILVHDCENVTGGEGCIDTHHMIGNVAEATRSVRLHLRSICEESAKNSTKEPARIHKTSLTNKSNQVKTVSETTKVSEGKSSQSGLQFVEPNSNDEMPCIITNVISLNPSNHVHLMSGKTPKVTYEPEETSKLETCVENRTLAKPNSVEAVLQNSGLRKRTLNFEGTPERDPIGYQQTLSFDKTEISTSSTSTSSSSINNSNARTISKDEVTVHSSQPNQSSQLVSIASQQVNVPLTVHQGININSTKQHWNNKGRQRYPNKGIYPKPFQIREKKNKKKNITNISRRYRPLLPKPGPSESHQLTSEWMQNSHYREQLQQNSNRQEETNLEKQGAKSCPQMEYTKDSGLHSSISRNRVQPINPISSREVADGVSRASVVSNSDKNIRVFNNNNEFTNQLMPRNMKENQDFAFYPNFDRNFGSFVRPSSLRVNSNDILKSQLPSCSNPSARLNNIPCSYSTRVAGYDEGLIEPNGETIVHSQPQVASERSSSSNTVVSNPVTSQKLIILGDYTQPFYSMYSKCNLIDVADKEKTSHSHVTVTPCHGLPQAYPSNIEDQSSASRQGLHKEKTSHSHVTVTPCQGLPQAHHSNIEDQSSASRQGLCGLADTHEGVFKVSGHLDSPGSSTEVQSKTYTAKNPSSAQLPASNAGERLVINSGCDSRFRPSNRLTRENSSSKKKKVTNPKELEVHLRSFVGCINQQTYSQYARKLGGPSLRSLMPILPTPQNAQGENLCSFAPSAEQQTSRSLVITADTTLAEGVPKTNSVSSSYMSDATPFYAQNNVNVRPGGRHSQYSRYIESTPNRPHQRGDFPEGLNPPGNFQSRNSQTLRQCYSIADSSKDGALRNPSATTTNTVSSTEKILPVSSEPLNSKKQSDLHSVETISALDIAAVKSEFHSSCQYTASVAGSTVTTTSDSSIAFACSKNNQDKGQSETYVISDLLRDIKVEPTENAQNRGAFIPYSEHKQNIEAQSKINCAKGRYSSVYRILQSAIACVPLIGSDRVSSS